MICVISNQSAKANKTLPSYDGNLSTTSKTGYRAAQRSTLSTGDDKSISIERILAFKVPGAYVT